MFTLNGKVIDINSKYWDEATQTEYPLRDPVIRARFGVVEVPDQVRPQPEDHYYITTDANGFEVYTPKPQAQINEVENNKILAQIEALERKEMLPRGVREALIETIADKAIAMGAAAPSNFTLAQFSEMVAYVGITLTQAQLDAVALGNVPPLDATQSLVIAYAFNIAYRNYVDFDNQIAALRAQLIK